MFVFVKIVLMSRLIFVTAWQELELASVLYLKCFEYYFSVIWPLLTNVSIYMKCADLANLVTLREKTK